MQNVADRTVEYFFVYDIGGPDQEGITIRGGVAIVPFAVCFVEFCCGIDLREGFLVQPAMNLAKGIAGDLGGFAGLLKSLLCGISSECSAIAVQK